MDELSGKVAIVTGASRGIGAATARELGSHGVAVILAARSSDACEEIASEITNAGGKAKTIACDVANWDDMQAVFDLCESSYGSVDILVNNAGVIEPIARIGDSDPAAWARAGAVNYKGVYYGLRLALPIMEKQSSGVIVNVSSGAATSPMEGWAHYCSAKAGALMLTRCAHEEYGHLGVRVVGLSPGTVATEMQVLIKKSGINAVSQLDPSVHIPAEWPARAIAWLCTSDAAEFGGTDFSINTMGSQ